MEPAILLIDHQANTLSFGDNGFQCQPLKFSQAIGKPRRNVDRKRHTVPFKNGICNLEIIAVTVVEGEAGKTLPEFLLGEAPMHLIE
jgi:hypothetical protein